MKNELKIQYEKETGDIEPTNQIFYHEWYERYVKWLETKVKP